MFERQPSQPTAIDLDIRPLVGRIDAQIDHQGRKILRRSDQVFR
jgi:hypothetical protein